MRQPQTFHGMKHTNIYYVWTSMKNRCSNHKVKAYKHYGGRGIKVCDRWMAFLPFFEDMGFPPSKKHSIDRIDVDGNYEPGNCRWATAKQQRANQRPRASGYLHAGQIASLVGISRQRLYQRIDKYGSMEAAIREWKESL